MTDSSLRTVFKQTASRSSRGVTVANLDLGRKLRLLTGVHEELLDEVPTDRTRYTALGGVVLGTATIAMFSMFMALTEALGDASVLLVFPVVLWGMFVLNLDRWLVASATGTQWGRRLALLLPRLALAVFFGVIIAEPLVLRIFQTAIEEHINQQRQDDLGALRTALIVCNPVPARNTQVAELNSTYCLDRRLAIGVDPAADAAELANLQKQAADLQKTVTDETSQQAALTADANGECSGAKGPGYTGRIGYGRQCTDRKAAADQYAATHPVAQHQLQLAEVQGNIAKLSTKVSTGQAAYQQQLTDAVDQRVADRKSHQGSIGMLERFRALEDLISTNGFLFGARWTVSIFFILIDCLPVLAKLLGGITAYDRLVDRASNSAERIFDANSRQREDDLLADADSRRYWSQTRARKDRNEADLDFLRHKNEMQNDVDHQTDQLTEHLISKAQAAATQERSRWAPTD